MKRNITTIAMCITASGIAFLIGYGAFVWGFMQGAYKLAPEVQTTVTASQNASQLTITPQIYHAIQPCGGW
jgi:predicted benzoate:H+ symporter BenE